MAVAAGARALDGHALPTNVYFATSSPAYADKTNASAIHAALGLPYAAFATDLGGTGRSGVAAWRAAATTGGLAVTADVRVGRPGSADERLGGDGAAALLFGDGPAIADVLATTSHTAEFLDRWRSPRVGHRRAMGGALRRGSIRRADPYRGRRILDDNGLAEVDHVVVACPNSAIVKRVATAGQGAEVHPHLAGWVSPEPPTPGSHWPRCSTSPNPTRRSWWSRPSTAVTRSCCAPPPSCRVARQAIPVGVQRAEGIVVPHLTYLSWHGLVELEPPRRPEPDRPAAPPAARAEEWKFGLAGTRCRQCGFVHLPPVRVCRSCGTHRRDGRRTRGDAARHHRHPHRRLPRLFAVAADDPSCP